MHCITLRAYPLYAIAARNYVRSLILERLKLVGMDIIVDTRLRVNPKNGINVKKTFCGS